MTASTRPADVAGPVLTDVVELTALLDMMEDFPSNEQRARYLLTCNWLRERGAAVAAHSAAQLAALTQKAGSVTAPTAPPRPTVSSRLIAALDAQQYPVPTAGAGARDQVIVEQVIPLARSFEGVELTGKDISLLAWLIVSGEGAHFAELLSRVRHW